MADQICTLGQAGGLRGSWSRSCTGGGMPARVLFSFLFGYAVSAIAVTQTLAPGTVFRDCPDCPEMVVVPAGSFVMGSPESEVSRDKDESPQHRVTIARSFAVGRHEVTRGQFRSEERRVGKEWRSRGSPQRKITMRG